MKICFLPHNTKSMLGVLVSLQILLRVEKVFGIQDGQENVGGAGWTDSPCNVKLISHESWVAIWVKTNSSLRIFFFRYVYCKSKEIPAEFWGKKGLQDGIGSMQRRGRSAVNGCRVFGLGVKMHSKLDLEEEEEREEWKEGSVSRSRKKGEEEKVGDKEKKKGREAFGNQRARVESWK